jgi:hypothetical protein
MRQTNHQQPKGILHSSTMNLFTLLSLMMPMFIVISMSKPTINTRPASFDVVKFLDSVNGELPTTLRTQKYKAMEASAFIFYRGANQLYFRDVGMKQTKKKKKKKKHNPSFFFLHM